MKAKKAAKFLDNRDKNMKKTEKQEDRKKFFALLFSQAKKTESEYEAEFRDSLAQYACWAKHFVQNGFAVDWAINNKKYLEKLGYKVSVSTEKVTLYEDFKELKTFKYEGLRGLLGMTYDKKVHVQVPYELEIRVVIIKFK